MMMATSAAMIAMMSMQKTKKMALIHSGDVTHHQDQSITFVSLSVKNTTNRIVLSPKPPELDFDSVLISNVLQGLRVRPQSTG